MSDPEWLARIPADRCYWAVCAPVPGKAPAPAAGFRFEEYLPCPIERLRWQGVPLADGRLLLVGAEIDSVGGLLASRPEAWVVRPDALAASVLDHGVDPGVLDSVDLATGTGTTPAARRAGRHLRLLAIGMVGAVMSAVMWTGWSAGTAWLSEAQRAGQQANAIAEAAVPSVPGERPMPAQARLLQAFRGAQAAGSVGVQGDAMLLVDAVLRAMPTEAVTAWSEIQAEQRRLLVRISIRDLDALHRITEATARITMPDGGAWKLQPTDLPAQEAAVRTVDLVWLPDVASGAGR